MCGCGRVREGEESRNRCKVPGRKGRLSGQGQVIGEKVQVVGGGVVFWGEKLYKGVRRAGYFENHIAADRKGK